MEMTADTLVLGVVWYAAFLFSLTVHEAAHAWASLKLGDETAYLGGQVTLNPVPHMQREPVGTMVVPLLSYALAGWVMGWASAPYDPRWADRYPRRAAWMALAGPASNLLITLACGVFIRVGIMLGTLEIPQTARFIQITAAAQPGIWESLATLLSILFSLNLLLFVFNLIPLPPLDGSAVLPLFIKETWARSYQEFMQQPGFGLLGLVVAWQLIGYVFQPLQLLSLTLLYPEISFR
ncbi:MAG: site-2 protease family protein [Acidobacteriota bacterium]